MKRLYKQRLSTHLIHMTKYLKYVFNDFFVIALIFFVGGLGLTYSNFLKTLHSGEWWLMPLIGIVMLIMIQFGRLATLTQNPDYVFLLPKDKSMKMYLKQALKYSGCNAVIVQAITWFVLLPILRIQTQLSWPSLISWLFIIIILKLNLLLSVVNRDFQSYSWLTATWLNRFLFPALIIAIGLLISPWISLMLGIILLMNACYMFKRQSSPLNWLRVIRLENHRMHDIYTIFNMFVDVPNFGSAISRRRYLSPLFKLIHHKRQNTYLYLYWHGFIRDKEFSGLYARLVVIGLIILIFINGSILSLIMGLVFTYLIVFQIIPFYFHFEDNAFVHIYPLKNVNQLRSFQKMLWILMGLAEVLFLLGNLVSKDSLMNSAVLLITMTAEVYGMVNFYLPKQVRKHN